MKLTKHCCQPKEFIHLNKLLQVHKNHNPNYCLRILFNNFNLCTILLWRLCVCNWPYSGWPMTHAKITSCPLWKTTISREHDSIVNNHIWCLQDISQGKMTITNKLVFRTKVAMYDIIEKLYARLMAPNFEHIQTIDFQETFCSHCKMGNHTSCSGFNITKVVED